MQRTSNFPKKKLLNGAKAFLNAPHISQILVGVRLALDDLQQWCYDEKWYALAE